MDRADEATSVCFEVLCPRSFPRGEAEDFGRLSMGGKLTKLSQRTFEKKQPSFWGKGETFFLYTSQQLIFWGFMLVFYWGVYLETWCDMI